MKIVSKFMDGINHLMRGRASDGSLVAWCGAGGFGKLPDGDAANILEDAVQRHRVCPLCLEALEAAGLPSPVPSLPVGWNPRPGSARQ